MAVKFSKEKYYIELVGIANDSIGQVIIDSKYALVQLYKSDSTAITPLVSINQPTFSTVVFYTHCLTYLHDIPGFVWPANGKALTKPIEIGRADYLNQSYFDALRTAYEAINSFRFGPLGYIYFRCPGFSEKCNLSLSLKYSIVSQEIALYSTAVRQLDPLSEFLGYYRVIESVSGSNGKDWLSANLDRLKKYDFGFLEYEIVGDERIRNQRRKNLFSLYRKRALSRLRILTQKLSIKKIAEYFYNENRCGIAHGKTGVKTYDFDLNIREISQDVYILKLLARIAIEDKSS
jgi:hypothetical protein